MKCWIDSEKNRFAWNVSANVGLNSPNNLIDVSLVQFGLKARVLPDVIGQLGDSQEFQELIKKMVLGTPCTGQKNDPLVQLIECWQRQHSMAASSTKDGKVSVLTDATYGANNVRLLKRLNNVLRNAYPSLFPRLDLMPNCPANVKSYVRMCMALQKNEVLP